MMAVDKGDVMGAEEVSCDKIGAWVSKLVVLQRAD